MLEQARHWLPGIALIVVLIGFANFAWFVGESSVLGGDGLNGFERDGQYYVASHGTVTEVSEAEWRWSRAHAVSVIGTHLLSMAGMGFLLWWLLRQIES